jgi:hypothetical protein
MSILDYPIRVDRESERIYFFDGRVSVDMNGSETERRQVLEFLARTTSMARFIKTVVGGHGWDVPCACDGCDILRAAGCET